MKKTATPCRSRRKVLPNCNARPTSDAPASAGSESIPLLQGSERNARLCQSFRLNVPGSTSAALAAKRCFFRTVFDADKIGVCVTASPNFPEKSHRQTRGFTSCSVSSIQAQMNSQPSRHFHFGNGGLLVWVESPNTSVTLHLSRFNNNSRVFNVTFCSPISIR